MNGSRFKHALAVGLAGTLLAAPLSHGAEPRIDYQKEPPAAPLGKPAFHPPAESDIPKGPFGDMVRLGKDIFVDTQTYAWQYVGNGLNCANCHLDAGRLAHSAPLWAAYVAYPAYRKKDDKVNTFEERIQGCFRYSMNGTPPAMDSKELTALVTYSYWLAKSAPTGERMSGRGYPALPKPPLIPDYKRGGKVFQQNCAVCHGENGQGTKVDNRYAFPPLWGRDSYNWGAGMHRINTAAAFIKANMPLGLVGKLTDQEAWDVALYFNSHDRPPDPRFTGSLEETRKKYHDHNCEYGHKVEGRVLGAPK